MEIYRAVICNGKYMYNTFGFFLQPGYTVGYLSVICVQQHCYFLTSSFRTEHVNYRTATFLFLRSK